MKGSKKLKHWLKEKNVQAKIFPTHQDTSSVDASSKMLGIKKEDIVKSVVFKSNQGIILAIVQGNRRVAEPKLQDATGVEWIKLSDPRTVKETTGYSVGGVPPVGHDHEDAITYVLDTHVLDKEWVYAGGGDSTSQLKIRVKDLKEFLSPIVEDIGEKR